jgi:hypothetical protein
MRDHVFYDAIIDGNAIPGRRPGVPSVIVLARTAEQVNQGFGILKLSALNAYNVDVEAAQIDQDILCRNREELGNRPIGRTIRDHYSSRLIGRPEVSRHFLQPWMTAAKIDFKGNNFAVLLTISNIEGFVLSIDLMMLDFEFGDTIMNFLQDPTTIKFWWDMKSDYDFLNRWLRWRQLPPLRTSGWVDVQWFAARWAAIMPTADRPLQYNANLSHLLLVYPKTYTFHGDMLFTPWGTKIVHKPPKSSKAWSGGRSAGTSRGNVTHIPSNEYLIYAAHDVQHMEMLIVVGSETYPEQIRGISDVAKVINMVTWNYSDPNEVTPTLSYKPGHDAVYPGREHELVYKLHEDIRRTRLKDVKTYGYPQIWVRRPEQVLSTTMFRVTFR